MQLDRSEGAPTASGSLAATMDGAGWGLFLIWVGICLLADLAWSVFFLGAGVLMVAGQAARTRFGLGIDRFALVLGGCMALAGLVQLLELPWQSAAVPGWTAPVIFIAIGAALVVKAWRRRHGP